MLGADLRCAHRKVKRSFATRNPYFRLGGRFAAIPATGAGWVYFRSRPIAVLEAQSAKWSFAATAILFWLSPVNADAVNIVDGLKNTKRTTKIVGRLTTRVNCRIVVNNDIATRGQFLVQAFQGDHG